MTKIERLRKRVEAAKIAEEKQKALAKEIKQRERELATLERDEAAKKFRSVFQNLISDDEILEKTDEEILKFLIKKLTTTTQS